MLVGGDAFNTIATQLKDAVLVRMQDAGLARPGRAYVTSGLVAWDKCDCNGQLVVTVAQSWFSSSFPGQAGQFTQLPPCEVAYRVAELGVHLIRCAARPEEDGLPTPANLERSGLEVERDAWAITAGVFCKLDAMQDAYDIAEYVVGLQPRVGPQGGCVGSTLTVIVGLVNVCPCQ